MTTLPSWSVNTVLVPSPAHTFFSNNSGGSLNAFPVAFKLPPELFEKNVWAGDGTRTVFTDQDGNVVM